MRPKQNTQLSASFKTECRFHFMIQLTPGQWNQFFSQFVLFMIVIDYKVTLNMN